MIASLPPTVRAQAIASLTEADAADLLSDWRFWARPEQIAPDGDWRIWLFLAGRGAGKTRAGAEWIAEGVRRGTMVHVGLIGASHADVRAVMVEGESGLKTVCPSAVYQPTNRRVRMGKATLHLISADEPDAVRGYQFDAIWADEFCKWPDPKAALDMALMALRLGAQPRMLITTTPRPIKALTDLLAGPDVVVSRCATAANAVNLAPGFLTGLERRYGGTALARQELDGEIIADNKNALWQRGLIETARVTRAPELSRVVVAVDPPASVGRDECGIVVTGLGADGALYVLADISAGGLSPAGWSARVAAGFKQFRADLIVAEANQGGAMVEQVLLQALPNAPVRLVHAVRNKRTRAMPAALLYEQGRVHHVGSFAALEDQMCQYDGTGASPDRMDALVWALCYLVPVGRARPHIRSL